MLRVSRIVVSLSLVIAALALAITQISSASAQTDSKALATAWIAAINAGFKSGDATAIMALYSPDFASDSGKGADALNATKTNFAGLLTAFPDGKLDVKDMVAEGNKVAVYTVFGGTNTGALGGGMGATGKAVSGVKGMDIVTFQDGKIVKDDSVTDLGSLYVQLGFNITPPTTTPATPAAK